MAVIGRADDANSQLVLPETTGTGLNVVGGAVRGGELDGDIVVIVAFSLVSVILVTDPLSSTKEMSVVVAGTRHNIIRRIKKQKHIFIVRYEYVTKYNI